MKTPDHSDDHNSRPYAGRLAPPADAARGRTSPASTAAGIFAPSPSTTTRVCARGALLQALRRGTSDRGSQCETNDCGDGPQPALARAGGRPASGGADRHVGRTTAHAGAVSEGQGLRLRDVRAQIPCAHRVVMGELEWSPTQARVFATLLDKCLPDLSASFVQDERAPSDLCVMSRRDLEALAAGTEVRRTR